MQKDVVLLLPRRDGSAPLYSKLHRDASGLCLKILACASGLTFVCRVEYYRRRISVRIKMAVFFRGVSRQRPAGDALSLKLHLEAWHEIFSEQRTPSSSCEKLRVDLVRQMSIELHHDCSTKRASALLLCFAAVTYRLLLLVQHLARKA